MHLQTPNGDGVHPNKKHMESTSSSRNGTTTYKGTDIIVRNDHKPLARFLNGKNENTKINRWGLELTSYNITFEWISGAKNKAADCLSRLVELPRKHLKNPNGTKPTLINMVKVVTTRSVMRKTLTVKEPEKQPPLETNLNKNETPRTVVSKETTSNSRGDNPKDTSIKEMQSTDPFCKRIMKRLLNKTAPKHESNTFFIHNGLLYRYASDHSKDFCTLVIPKAWRYTILVETHHKMGHQGNNRTYSLIKRQYYWKGMAKDVKDYIQRCPACRQEKARVQSYPLHMTKIPDRPFDKIAMDLVTDFTESNKGKKTS